MQAAASENVVQVALPFRQPRPRVRWLVLILAAAGWWLSFDLLQASVRADHRLALEPVCASTPELDCTSVIRSPYAYIQISPQPGVPKIPLGLGGMLYFSAVFAWY